MSHNNNHNKDNEKKNKKNLYQFLDKEGFYIILFLCVCIVAVTAMWVSNQNQDPIIGENPSGQLEENSPDVTLVEDPSTGDEESSETVVIPKTDKKETDIKPAPAKEESEPKPENKKETVEQEKETSSTKGLEITMMLPVMGKYGLSYADDKLVYHKTLDQWSTHRGIDIHADQGTPVRAALDGEVLEVVNDTVMGITITLEHQNDLLTRYSSLSTDAMVKVGDSVMKGQIISGVGKTASIKAEEGPLLHFQVIYDGKTVNPMAYLPKNN